MRSILERAAILAGNEEYLKILRENTELNFDTSDDNELEISGEGSTDDTNFEVEGDEGVETDEMPTIDGDDVFEIEVSVDLNDGEFSFEEFTEGLPELIKSAEFIDEDSDKEFDISDVEITPSEEGTGFIITITGSGENLEDFIDVLINDVLEQDPEPENDDISIRAELISPEDGGDFSDNTLSEPENNDKGDLELGDGSDEVEGDEDVVTTLEAIADVNSSNLFRYGDDTLRVKTDTILGKTVTKVIKESDKSVLGSVTVDRGKKIAFASYSKKPLDFYTVDYKSPEGIGRMIIENVLNENTVLVDGHEYDYSVEEFRGIKVIEVKDINGENVGLVQLNHNSENAFVEYSDGSSDGISYYEFLEMSDEDIASWIAATYEPSYEEEEENTSKYKGDNENTVLVDGHEYDYSVEEFRGIKVIEVKDINGENVGLVQLNHNSENAFVEYSDGSSDGISYYEFLEMSDEDIASWIAATYEPSYEEEEENTSKYKGDRDLINYDRFGDTFEIDGELYDTSIHKFGDVSEVLSIHFYFEEENAREIALVIMDHSEKTVGVVDRIKDPDSGVEPDFYIPYDVVREERKNANDYEDVARYVIEELRKRHVGS